MSNQALPIAHHHLEPLRTVAPHLLHHLPHTLPLLRRIQHQPPSPTSLVLATFAPCIPIGVPIPIHYAVLYVDRASAPETECWMFSSFERGKRTEGGHLDQTGTSSRRNLFALLSEVMRLGMEENMGNIMLVGSLNEELLGLLGAEEVWPLKAENVLTEARYGYTDRARSWLDRERERLPGDKRGGAGVIAGVSMPYTKWILTPSRAARLTIGPEIHGGRDEHDSEEAVPRKVDPTASAKARPKKITLPDRYTFSHVKKDELRIVTKSSKNQKTEEALMGLGSVAIRYYTHDQETETRQEQDKRKEHGNLVAWAFLDVDGSLINMNVEPDHRGKRLAEAIVDKIIERLASNLMELGFYDVYAEDSLENVNYRNASLHIDVAMNDIELHDVVSSSLFEEGWRVRWVKIDLERVQMIIKRLGWL